MPHSGWRENVLATTQQESNELNNSAMTETQIEDKKYFSLDILNFELFDNLTIL